MIIEARLTRDTDFFTKMDPYATLQTKKETYKTHTMQGADIYDEENMMPMVISDILGHC